MSAEQKTINGKVKALVGIGKWVGLLFLSILLLFLLAHFGLQYGFHLENLSTFFQKYWLIWLCVRLAIYSIIGILLFKTRRHIKEDMYETYKRLIRATILGVIVIELINVMQLVRG